MAVTQEEKQAEVKKLKKVVHEMGENLASNNFEEAFQLANDLKAILEGEIIQELRVKEANELHIEDIKKQLNRYWYNNRQMRMFAGGLRKNGSTLMDLVN
ncbi:hypothetical protein [Streptococcus gallolyticus]|uniref:Uncharacterized protein n=1 Tax=Streptococcus gallolyticus TaxID=315405 RepID=A0A139R342_9STRE|nr:hypothetical protein [Streptococcus gallolyticus]KXT64430.1 hypothetical protein SGADD02_02060 [Streptococcus gallolyticus]KXU09147.1 hypothetical protein SGADD03_01002 [Streptococcus gallolyticus]